MEVLGLGAVLFVVLVVVAVRTVGQSRREYEAKAPEVLDRAFDGREYVTFTVSMGTLPFEQVVIGARERGYRLDSQSGRDSYGTQTLVFAKVPQGASPS
jgi:hypothetical protein